MSEILKPLKYIVIYISNWPGGNSAFTLHNVTSSPCPSFPYREWMQNGLPVNLICRLLYTWAFLRILVISRPPNVTPSPSPCSPYQEWMQNFFPVNLICIWPYKKAISVVTPSFLDPPNVRLRPPNVRNFKCSSTQEGLPYPKTPLSILWALKKVPKNHFEKRQFSKKSKKGRQRATFEGL